MGAPQQYKTSLRTQSVRMPSEKHENWGSCVLIGGRARGQVMAGFGDRAERQQTGVLLGLVHVYIHEIPCSENVVAVVQSDGVSNSLSLEECGRRAWTCRIAEEYLSTSTTHAMIYLLVLRVFQSPKDDSISRKSNISYIRDMLLLRSWKLQCHVQMI